MRWRDTQLIQTGRHSSPGDRAAWALRGVRTSRYTYLRRVDDGTSFLYDRRVDPFEATDVAHQPRYRRTLAALRHRTDVLIHCAGASCNRTVRPGAAPSPPMTSLAAQSSRASIPSGHSSTVTA